MCVNSSSPLPQYVTTLIRITAKRTIGSCGFTKSDQDDLEQQVTLEVIRRRAKFDPAKAQENTFLARLVKHAIADIIAARKAGNRDYRREDGSLDALEKNSAGEWARRGDNITEEDVRLRVCQPGMSQEELRDLAIDMADAAASLPGDLRGIYEHLKKLGSARAVARAMGLHHSIVCDAKEQIRRRFEAAGILAYLGKRRSTPTDRGPRW